jgi:hypothetical protein
MNAQKQIIDTVCAFQRKKFNYTLISGIVNSIVLISVIVVSTLIADSVLVFSTASRWFVLLLNSLISILVLSRQLHYPVRWLLLRKTDSFRDQSAREIGLLWPETGDRLLNQLQLIKSKGYPGSDELRHAAIERFATETANFNYSSRLSLKSTLLSPLLISAVIAGNLVLIATQPDSLRISGLRLLFPDQDFSPVPEFQYTIMPGDTTIVRGDKFIVQMEYEGPAVSGHKLEFREPGTSAFQSAGFTNVNGSLQAAIPEIRGNRQYRVRGTPIVRAEWQDKLISDLYTVKIIDAPELENLQLRIIPPAYTRLPEQEPERNSGDIVAYAGSKIEIRAESEKLLSSAAMVFSDSNRQALIVRENRLRGEYNVSKSTGYHFKLIDTDGIENRKPIEYQVTMLEDLPPVVEIVEPGQDVEMYSDGALNLLVEAGDDFGFSELNLHYQILSGLEEVRDTTWYQQQIKLPGGSQKLIRINHVWDFSRLPVGFDDVIKYYVAVADNDRVHGPKSTRSSTYYVRFPSAEKMFEEFDQHQAENMDDMKDAVDESEKLKRELEEISREMKREKELNWERKEQLESMLEKQKQVQQKMNDIREEIEQAVQKLAEKQMLSPEILEKYQQLQQLFQDIMTPELQQALDELQKSLENMNKNQVQNAVEKFKINQERLRENLERTYDLFKKIQLEQELDRMAKLAEKLKEEQAEISQQLQKEATGAPKDEKLATRQKAQEQDLAQLERSLESVQKNEMVQQNAQLSQDMQDARQMISQEQMAAQMQQLQQQMQKQRNQQTRQQSQQMQQNLQKLQDQIQQARDRMMQQDMEKVMAKMERTSQNLLSLSEQQEKLMKDTRSLSNLSDQFREKASGQQQIGQKMSRVVKDIVDLSRETFHITPQLGKALGQAQANMQKSIGQLEERNQFNAARDQAQAMAALNEAVMNMQQSMQQMQQSGSSSGFEQFMQQMQQMAGQQGQLNEESLSLMQGQGNQGSMTREQQGQMGRMAAQQRALQRAMEQMHDQSGERSDVLGRLDKIAEEMKEVADAMSQMRLDRKTIERQQRILSRMLDASKSMREKEYSRQRKAEVGKEYVRRSPSGQQETEDERKARLSRDLMRALQEGYAPDYEKLIEAYFKALNQRDDAVQKN